MPPFTFLRWLFCRHRHMTLLRPLRYGVSDDAVFLDRGYRSLWVCQNCCLHEYRRVENDMRPPVTGATNVFTPEAH
jgi:hypothetical protein